MENRLKYDVELKGYTGNEEYTPKVRFYAVTPEVIAGLLRYMEQHFGTRLYSVSYASNLSFELKRPDG